MILLRADKIARAVAINQLQRVGLVQRWKQATARHRGGNAWWRESDERACSIAANVYGLLRRFAGDLAGKVAIEIGPGDNIGVAYCFLRGGCRKIIAVERISSLTLDERSAALLRRLDQHVPTSEPTFPRVVRREGGRYVLDPDRLEFRTGIFEDLTLSEPVDLIYSNDVMEHVDDPAAVFRAAHRLLAPGGLFINSIDLGGHNSFWKKTRPLDYLSCNDWLWDLMFSNLVTTNRVRYGAHLAAAKAAGFTIEHVAVLRKADPGYLAELRPHLLPRFSALPDDDLEVVQCVLVARR